jgi:hypothetical protein
VGVGGRRAVLVFVHKKDRDHVCGWDGEASYIHERYNTADTSNVREYLRAVEHVDGVTGGDDCVFGVADFGGRGAAVRVCAVLALQPGSGSTTRVLGVVGGVGGAWRPWISGRDRHESWAVWI